MQVVDLALCIVVPERAGRIGCPAVDVNKKTVGLEPAGEWEDARDMGELVAHNVCLNLLTMHTIGIPVQGKLVVQGEFLNIEQTFPTEDVMLGMFIRVVEAFSRSIEADTEPDIPGTNGLQIVKITNAILESSRTGKAIKI